MFETKMSMILDMFYHSNLKPMNSLKWNYCLTHMEWSQIETRVWYNRKQFNRIMTVVYSRSSDMLDFERFLGFSSHLEGGNVADLILKPSDIAV